MLLTEIDVSETATAYFTAEAVPSSYADVKSHAWLTKRQPLRSTTPPPPPLFYTLVANTLLATPTCLRMPRQLHFASSRDEDREELDAVFRHMW